MALFPSEEWCKELQAMVNNSAAFYESAKDFTGRSLWVINPDQALTRPVYLYFSFDHGKLVETGEIPDRSAREVDDTSIAPLGTWRRILEGKLNPTPAIVRGQIKIEGKAMHVMRNVKSVQALFEHALQLPTEFAA